MDQRPRRPTFTEEEALQFHQQGKPGKLEVTPTKPMATQRDLSLAYSPGVAVPVRRIAEKPETAYDYTAKGNLVAVISNGTAILGLGDLGALASKPVMEGKAVLFKRFADVDSIDLEVDTKDVDQFIGAVRYLGPSFGGINLEDIKAPDCFIIEQRLREMMDIPVFHDDQHGTAIIATAGLINALHLTGRDLKSAKIVVPHQVIVDRISLGEAIAKLVERLKTEPRTSFRTVLEGSSERQRIVVTFLAMLEMCKLGLVRVYQEEGEDDILISARDPETLSSAEVKDDYK